MKKVGLLIPKTNLTVEYELQYLFNTKFFDINNIVFYTSKLEYKTSYKENKEQFLKDLATDSINKIKDLEYLKVNYITFFCTSSAIINSDIVVDSNPFVALLEESKQKEVTKCMLITPYNADIGNSVKEELEKNNIVVCKNYNLDLLDTNEYFDFGKNKLKEFIIDNYKEEYENIIISCTNIPTLEVIDELEIALGINIISSNSSLFNKIKREMEEK